MQHLYFKREQLLPATREELFAFFVEPGNLSKITPADQGFHVVSSSTPRIEEGTVLEYKLSAHGLPLRWRALISSWNPPHRFVDEQLSGPFRRWVHTHEFIERGDETLCRDSVEYKVWGGRLVDRLFIRRNLVRAFDYREQVLPEQLALFAKRCEE